MYHKLGVKLSLYVLIRALGCLDDVKDVDSMRRILILIYEYRGNSYRIFLLG